MTLDDLLFWAWAIPLSAVLVALYAGLYLLCRRAFRANRWTGRD